jgi:hypothetical protein
MSGIVTVFTIIWLSAAIGSFATKNEAPFDYALVSTILIGFGYFLFN